MPGKYKKKGPNFPHVPTFVFGGEMLPTQGGCPEMGGIHKERQAGPQR